MKFKVSLLFVGVLMLVGGCQHRYGYKYKNLEAWAVSSQTDESKIRTHLIKSTVTTPIPEVMVMLDGKEIYLRQLLTKNEVWKFIKKNKIKHRFESTDWEKLKTPNDMDEMHILLYAKNGTVKFIFTKQRLTKWWICYGEGDALKISSPKNKKYYSMPITISQLKKIFGEPLESMSGLSIK